MDVCDRCREPTHPTDLEVISRPHVPLSGRNIWVCPTCHLPALQSLVDDIPEEELEDIKESFKLWHNSRAKNLAEHLQWIIKSYSNRLISRSNPLP
jgi:Zn-finger protein